MDANPSSSNSPTTSHTDELLSSILDELKHIRKHLPPSIIRSECTSRAPDASHEECEGTELKDVVTPPLPGVTPESASKPPGPSYNDRERSKDLAAYQEFEKLMIDLDGQLERCADAARFLGSSAAFISSTYDLRDSLARLFSYFNLNGVVLYPEVKRTQRFPVTRLSVQRPNRDVEDKVDREPLTGYPFDGVSYARDSSIEELEKYMASISSMTELVNISLVESLRDFRSKVDRIQSLLFNLKPSMLKRKWMSQNAGECNESLKNLLGALKVFEEKTIPAIQYLQRDETDALQNQSTVATFLSAVTATTIQFTYATPNPSSLSISVNLLWLVSLTLSLGSAVTSQLAIRWKAAIYHNPDSTLSKLISKWIAQIPVAFLVASMLAFIAGLTSFTFLTFPRSVIPPVVTCFSGSCTLLLVVIGIWLGFEETLHGLPSRAATHLSGAVRLLYARNWNLFNWSRPQPFDVENNAQSVDKDDQEETGINLNVQFSLLSDRKARVDAIIRNDYIPIERRLVVEERLDDNGILTYDLSPDGSYVAALSKERDDVTFRLWSVEKPFKVVQEVRGLASSIGSFSWAPDGRSVALLEENDVVGFIVMEDGTAGGGRLIKRIFDHCGRFMSWAWDGKSILSVEQEDGGKVINVLGTDDIRISSHRFDILMDGLRYLHGVWCTRDNTRFVAVLQNNSRIDEVHVLNLGTGTSENSITLPEPTYGHIFSRRDVFAMILEKNGLVLVRVDMKEHEVKLKTTRLSYLHLRLPRFVGENDRYVAAVHAPDGLAAKILVWNVHTAEPLFSLSPPATNFFYSWSLRSVLESRQLLCMWHNEDSKEILIGRLDMDDILPGEDIVATSRLVHPGEGTEPDADVDNTDHADT